ncbi:hypothetical protein NLU13_3545 [Sarocladium strictum]|uniref:Uncharacterized protein n=1 Tax=Sarocladium strictum TaxID=5046 RepID=A0AA39LAC6_SARSR|nr:hypothetical protein NLU13_3545 [Sarocladium strictum]
MEDDSDARAMAQAMGFSAFGSQDPPAKKRRYNPHSDASLPASLPSNPYKSGASASGANSAPLGPPRKATNTEEIALDDADDDVQETAMEKGGVASLPQRPAAPAHDNGAHSRDRGSAQAHGQAGARGRGDFNPLWYQNYYDPSSNANPWDRLEKKLDLQPRDTWPSQAQVSQQPTQAALPTAT